jgi:Two component regulator propeller
MIAVSGGYDNFYAPLGNNVGFYSFQDGKWTNYNSIDKYIGSVPIPAARDLVGIAYHSGSKKAYLTSYQDGLLEWNTENNQFNLISSANSPFPANRMGGTVVDSKGNLWVGVFNSGLSKAAVFQRSGSNWKAYAVQSAADYPLEMQADDANNIWVRLGLGQGILVINSEGKQLYLDQSKGLPSPHVLCLAPDKKGNMWVGTLDGIRVYLQTSTVFQRLTPAVSSVIYKSREFLNGEKINAIAVDGGNRKWIGTEKGVWLYDEEKSDVLAHFTAANSPLLSDNVRSIAIHPNMGEVFFGTDKGIISYRSDATEAKYEYGDVKVFPNPVPPNFGGVVSISGLAQNANVKITDIAGRIVFETLAHGGTATWNGLDFGGNRVKTGMYMIYSSIENGEQTFVSKIAWIE